MSVTPITDAFDLSEPALALLRRVVDAPGLAVAAGFGAFTHVSTLRRLGYVTTAPKMSGGVSLTATAEGRARVRR